MPTGREQLKNRETEEPFDSAHGRRNKKLQIIITSVKLMAYFNARAL